MPKIEPYEQFDKSFAWWYLSAHQKASLRSERLKGRFGDTGKPIYWYPQEYGLSSAQIDPQFYIRKANQEFQSEWRDTVRTVLGRG